MIFMKQNPDSFYSKILLFGEYSILFDSMGLTVPFTHFKAELSFIVDDKYTDIDYARTSNAMLRALPPYLKELKESGELKCKFNIETFVDDLSNGLYFESSIPQGYGIGSSGALVAALYKRYASERIPDHPPLTSTQIRELRMLFAQLESFFHGTSSGIDPLNSYLKQPLLLKSREEIEFVGIPRPKDKDQGGIFLYNTGKPGKTGPLVDAFLEKCKSADFMQLVRDQLISHTNSCILNFISNKSEELFADLKQLSQFQFTHLKPMIPDNAMMMWQQGLETEDYFMKLCGSGGGGYMLGFTRNYENVKKGFLAMGIELVPVYLNS